MNHKNRRPKSFKGCCVMCACKDHDGGVRNKRTLSLAEVRHETAHAEDLDRAPRAAGVYHERFFWEQRWHVEPDWLDEDFVCDRDQCLDEVAQLAPVDPLRVPLMAARAA